jgi:hypothetical protein
MILLFYLLPLVCKENGQKSATFMLIADCHLRSSLSLPDSWHFRTVNQRVNGNVDAVIGANRLKRYVTRHLYTVKAKAPRFVIPLIRTRSSDLRFDPYSAIYDL